jgi:hypothetical protein
MERTGPTFLGAVMKEIACTPNTNFDPEDYRCRVIEPVRRIRRMDADVGAGDVPELRRREVAEMLASVLEAKGVEPTEREERLAGLARRFGLAEERPAAHAVVPSHPVERVAAPLAQVAAG